MGIDPWYPHPFRQVRSGSSGRGARLSDGTNPRSRRSETSHKGRERLLVRQGQQLAVESQLVAVKGPPQSGDELPAKDAAEHFHWQKEVRRRADPPRVVQRQSATRSRVVGGITHYRRAVCRQKCMGS